MRRLTSCLVFAVVCAMSQAGQDFAFTFDPANTWTDGTTRIQIFSSGRFKGTFDPFSNPLGTQTKFGPGIFGLTENDSIPASPYFELGHAALVRTSGTFDLNLDRATLKATLSNYVASRAPVNGLKQNATIALNNSAFRTLKPTHSFSANLAPLRLGLVTVDELKITQKLGSRTSSIVPLGGGNFAVAIGFMAEIEIVVREFGQTIPIRFDAPYSLVGLLHVDGNRATFGYGRGRGGDNISRQVNFALQPFPFVVPNGIQLPASFKMTTTINRIGLQINGVRKMLATAG